MIRRKVYISSFNSGVSTNSSSEPMTNSLAVGMTSGLLAASALRAPALSTAALRRQPVLVRAP